LGFAKYLNDSLPNATYVGFTGTPIDSTLDVFGQVNDSYTMTESVKDEITVRIVYEGRAAKVVLNNSKVAENEAYYTTCADAGSNELKIEESKEATTNLNFISGAPERSGVLATNFVEHYDTRVKEGSIVCDKTMFLSGSRDIAYALYQENAVLRPEWFEIKESDEAFKYSDTDKQQAIKAGKLGKVIERVMLVITRGKDDPPAMFKTLGKKDYHKDLDKQSKIEHFNFKLAIVVDM
jgi:type I restriction enzyme R subunit